MKAATLRRIRIVLAFVCCLGALEHVANAQCPGFGDCCAAQGEPGCGHAECCSIVCDYWPECCSDHWDYYCADLAFERCGDLCFGGGCPGTANCCELHLSPGCSDAECCGRVCASEPRCCTANWSPNCVELATCICDACDPPPDCRTGSCCWYYGEGCDIGCFNDDCRQRVCEIADQCCSECWDFVCSEYARSICVEVCGCDQFADFDGKGGVDLRDFAAFQNCFTGRVADLVPGCNCGDYDADGDIDLTDYRFLYGAFRS